MSAEPIPHEALLRHAGFLRRLARDLLGDHAAADDAVQEVWLRALEKPPRHDANVRGWLRVVLTNLVRSKARGESRRELRERAREHHEADPPASASSSEDEALLRAVTESVLALEEPLRSTVLQHYFQGLTTAEIAQREHLPVSTVKSRLQRALEILRVRMQRESGDEWRSALFALTMPAKIGKGVILVSLKTKLAVGSIVLLCAALAYRGFVGSLAPVPEPLASASHAAEPTAPIEPAPSKSQLDTDPWPSERTAEARAPAVPGVTVEEPPESLFYGTLRDPAGKPLAGLWNAGVNLTDSEGRRRYADAKEFGAFAFPALPYGKYWIAAGADGFRSAAATLELDAAHAQLKKDFTLQPVPIIKVRVTTPDGKSWFGEEHEDMHAKGSPGLVPIATKEKPGKWIKEVVGSLNNSFGIGTFWQYGPRAEALPQGYMGIVMLDQELPAFVSLVNYHRVLQTKELQPGEDEVQFVISIEDLEASMATLRLQVVDATTKTPLQDARASLWGGPSSENPVSSDAGGNLVFEGREPGEFDLHVSAKGHEEYKARVLLDAGTPTDLGEIALDKVIEFQIKVIDAEGAPRNSNFSLGTWNASTRTLNMERQQIYPSHNQGVLELPGLGRRVYVVRTTNLDAVNEQVKEDPKWVSGNVLLDLRSGTPPANLVIELVPATRVMLVLKDGRKDRLRFRVTDEQGMELVSSHFYGDGPRPLTLPQGKYQLALLDAEKKVLAEQPLVVGSTLMTVELSR